ncbi:MAG: wax ester/triacylglycerol synthase family O-acyltransferase [Moraxella sp.]|nr:wax ester/triacylglycerol synthase family O-acyltransferase [Moraxella sp.]
MHKRALTAVDHLFLTLETQKQPMHVAGLCIFELPSHADDDFLYRLIDDMKIGKVAPTFPFNQALYQKLFWRTVKNFDVRHHFYHVALPSPAGMQELMTYVSREHSRIMDRQKPLWEFHLIEGLAPTAYGQPKRFAFFLKMHHAMVDGIAGMRLIQMSLSKSPAERLSLPIWSLTTRHRSQIDALLPIHKSASSIIKEQLGTLPPVTSELAKRFHKADSDKEMGFVGSFDAPPSMFNQRISAGRVVAARSFYKPDFVAIGQHFGVTTNDVILAVCAGVLRRYLLSQDALPTKPLIAFVPVSLRKDDSAVGNQLSFLLANLGTHKHHPVDRLYTIADSMQDGKERFSRMNQAGIINYSAMIYGWAGLNLAMGVYPKKQAFNLIISNVPGAQTPLYLNGARLSALYPASVLFDGQALNITLANYQDKIDIGITACDVALPNIDKLLDGIDDELASLQTLMVNRFGETRADL